MLGLIWRTDTSNRASRRLSGVFQQHRVKADIPKGQARPRARPIRTRRWIASLQASHRSRDSGCRSRRGDQHPDGKLPATDAVSGRGHPFRKCVLCIDAALGRSIHARLPDGSVAGRLARHADGTAKIPVIRLFFVMELSHG